MKKCFLVFMVGLLLVSGCGNEEQKIENLLVDTEELQEEVMEEDTYEGEYNDYDCDEPNLEILRNEDGTYCIQIGIFRLAYLEDGVGTLTEDGLEFSATAPYGESVEGIITLEEDIATVVFNGARWEEFAGISEFRYHKTSDVPNIYQSGLD